MGIHALIYVQRGAVPAHKQTELCLQYAMARGWRFSIVPAGAWRQAVKLIREGLASVLLLAYRDAATQEIIDAAEEAGGTVEVCRDDQPVRGSALGGHTDEFILRMAERGGTTGEIVRLLGVTEGRVRSILRRIRRR